MSAVMVRSQFSDLYGSTMLPALEELFRFEMNQHPSRRAQLFKQVSTDQSIYQTSEIHDLPMFTEVPENTDYTFSRAKQGYDKTYTPAKFGAGFSISMEAVDDGKFDMIADLTRKLARSAQESQEIQAMDVFNGAFSTTNTADGEDLCDAAHPLPSGGTWRNRLSTDSDLTETSLQTALSDFDEVFVGDTGIIYRKTPRILLVSNQNKKYAMELVGSDLKPDTNDNNLNSLKSDNLVVVSSPHLTDKDAWFVLSEPSETGLRIVTRQGIRTQSDEKFENDSILYKASYREAIGASHGYGIIGTPGAT